MMSIYRFLLVLLILFSNSGTVYSQSSLDDELQEYLLKESNFKDFRQNTQNQGLNEDVIAPNQETANTSNIRKNIDKTKKAKIDLNEYQKPYQKSVNSLLKKYFNSLTGEMLDIYGESEFSQSQDNDLLFFNTAGRDYELAPGDVVQVIITGLSASNETYQIENDGTITLEKTHPINVNGLNIDQVSNLILDKILLDDASANVFVRLSTARLITVQISGNVKSPRTIAVPAYTPLSRVLAYSGGVSDSGSLRKIYLTQVGEQTVSVDFYEFLQNPLPTNDPLIKKGARIFVPNKGPTIAASGFLGKPGIYELPKEKTNMKVEKLLELMGASFIPPGADLKISYYNSNGKAISRLASKFDKIYEGEALILDFIETRELNSSTVFGAVLNKYSISPDNPLSIKEVLKNGAVLTQNVYKPFALIIGKDVKAINLNVALEDDNISLPIGSDLRVFTKEEYLDFVASDPNLSLDPVASKIIKSNVMEIYLDNVRIAYVPVNQKQKRISIREALIAGLVLNEDGNLLNNNIFTPFSLIFDKKNQAINLDEVLANDIITLPAGSDLRLFTREKYLELVRQDPNESSDPIVSKLTFSNVAEIYLNGKRIAYVAPSILGSSRANDLFNSISDFYNLKPNTFTDIVLLQNNNDIEAFTLQSMVDDKHKVPLSKGDRLFFFENKFFDDLLKNITANLYPQNENIAESYNIDGATSPETLLLTQQIQNEEASYLDALRYSSNILQQANLVNIYLDGKLFSFLPYVNEINSSEILLKVQNRMPELMSEFVITQGVNSDAIPEIKNLNDPFEIKEGEQINFITKNAYRSIIKNYETDLKTNLLSSVRSSNAVKVYYNGSLALLLSPHYSPSQLKLFDQYYKKNDFYKLYIGLNTKNTDVGDWNLLTFSSEAFFSEANNLKLGPSNVVNLFSKDFIRNEFLENETNIKGVSFNIDAPLVPKANDDALSIGDKLNGDVVIDDEFKNNQNVLAETHTKTMKNSLRTISGSVRYPGSYPVADEVYLSDFISTAGLIKNTSKSNVFLIEAIKKEGRLVRGTPKIFKLDDLKSDKITLTGHYYLNVPLAINDAITGVIELNGEVLIPGNYSFTRSETVQDIIKRAGGLSDVAFPLGAVLQRESVKKLEKETNNILADQLEASILNLAQSSLEGAGDQVKVVLGYAQQLRNQPTVGRMALNIMEDNSSSPVFLEDGDKLTIPKRPSHVTVVGSVQRSTVATYVNGQNFYDYLQMAGGVTKIADIRKAYLLLPNGESRKLSKTTVIPVGSVIIVPPKLDRLSILGATDIVSRVLGNISDSILSIQNVD